MPRIDEMSHRTPGPDGGRQPRVSVIVPSYNHARFLRQRIESILGQSFQDFELILLDDCSTDDSVSILRDYQSHPRLSALVVNAQNSGSPMAQWKRGLGLAGGELVWIAESDDWAEPSFLATLVELFDGHPDLVLAYCRSERMDEFGDSLGVDSWPDAVDGLRWNSPFVADANREVEDYLSWRNTIPNASAVVFRRAAEEDVPVPLDTSFAGDWMFWILTLTQGGRIGYEPDVLNHFRTHPGTSRTVKGIQVERQRIREYLRAIELTGRRLHFSGPTEGRGHDWILREFQTRRIGHPFWLLSAEGVGFRSRASLTLAVVLRGVRRVMEMARS